MTKRKRRVLFVVAGFFLPLAAAAIWSVAVVLQARRATPALLARANSHVVHPVLRLADLSDWQKSALLRIEDPSFYEHHGVDLHTPGQGLTTITQSLVKWIYFAHFSPGVVNKIRQSLIARYVLDRALDKPSQLELFINMVYLGSTDETPVFGFARAAQVYYGKPLAQLQPAEYLSLVAMINSPQGFHLRERPAANAERVRRIEKVLSGEYKPKALRDMYYGPLDAETQTYLAPASYQASLYQ